MSPMEDLPDIVKRAQMGDKKAFEKLYNEYYGKIYRYCIVNIYKSELAQDICQETFIRAWKSLPTFTLDNSGTFQAYLFRIARNLIIDLSRKKKEFSLAEYVEIETHENYEEKIDKADEVEHLKKALAKLDEIDRQIITLRYFEELGHSEVAKIIGIKEGALRVRTIRLLKKIKTLLIKI
jgi:RNA polymerase sigma-70 factor (ECF subfamily)